MKLGDDFYESIIVADKNGDVVAIITDEEIIEHEDYKVIIEPAKQ